jgi:SAM-dependent methyltransferase
MATSSKDFSESSLRQRVHVACDLCGTDDPGLLFEKETFRYVRCRRCGLVYVTPRLQAIIERQKEFYEGLADYSGGFGKLVAKEYSGHRSKKLRAEAVKYLRYHITGHILDIGCGLGGFLRAASEQGWQHPEGIEIAPQAAGYVGRFFPVRTEPIEEVHYEANRFDVVRLNNVIEHLSSPKAVVRAVHRILRPGGLFAFSTPNFDSLSVAIWGREWLYFGGDDHIYLFGPKTLTRLLEDSGFRAVRVRTKGVHLALKNHIDDTPGTSLWHLPVSVSTVAERALDLIIRLTLKGHRLKIWAEKV